MVSRKFAECHCAAAPPRSALVKTTMHSVCTLLLNLLIVFFPKCPMCWAAYASLLGGVGLAHLPYTGWLLYFFIGLWGAHLFVLFKWAGYRPFALCLGGSLMLLFGRWVYAAPWWSDVSDLSFLAAVAL